MNEKYEKIISGVEIILPEETFKKRIETSIVNKQPLKIKLGFDPTSPDLHLGHLIVLKKLKDFCDIGHEINIIIGSFTAMIGDPTGKNKTRPPLTANEVKINSKTYIDQLSIVLDIEKIKIHFNNNWFEKFTGVEIYDLLSKYTINRLLTREDFSSRLKNNSEIHTHELLYPILQGYDSLEIEADIEIGGTDQLFNMQVGRHIQESSDLKSQHLICMPLLRGLDGKKKMSKSLDNYIGLTETNDNIKKKINDMPDCLIEEYIELLTDFSIDEKKKLISLAFTRSQEIKFKIAENIINQLS